VRPCLPHLDYLIVNDFEMGAIAGDPTVAAESADVARVTSAGRKVLALGAMRLVVAHFPAGAVVLPRGGDAFFVPSVDVPPDKVVGANGAGDAFAAGVIYGLHEGWELEAAVRLGHAAAAVSLRNLGTTTAVLPVADCLAMAAHWGWRAAAPPGD
jgi:sugar/nucleoside kinase (ribokinase family)